MEIISPTAQAVKSSLSEEELQKLMTAAKNIIEVFGFNTEGVKDSPQRMVKAWQELLTASEPDITCFSSNGYDQMIIQKDIPFYTFCEHHFLPFFGKVKIGYIPDGRIIGLSKLARIVNYYSKSLNTQEYFTKKIAEYLWNKLQPKGVGVVVEGTHLCQVMRGVKSNGIMVTSELLGVFRQLEVREEFLKL